MSTYNQTVQEFSDDCFRRLGQPLSKIDGINFGFGATLVRFPLAYALVFFCLFHGLTDCPGCILLYLRRNQRLLLRQVEAG